MLQLAAHTCRPLEVTHARRVRPAFEHLRWLEIVYWRVRPVPLNTATESWPMHATFKLNMLRARAQQARTCANNNLVPSKSLENLDFDQKYL